MLKSVDTNMSVDNTSHRGRPGLDELVPSRYALRVRVGAGGSRASHRRSHPGAQRRPPGVRR
jgi:hypothetical protein